MNRETKKILNWALLALVLIGSFLFIMFANSGGEASDPSIITDGEWAKGNLDSEVVLVEYSDFQCPACKARLPLIEDIFDEFQDDIKFVYRHFPLRTIHINAQSSAQAAEAAGIQGKFWEMHDALFATQSNWERMSVGEAKDFYVGLAEELGLDTATFESDMNSTTVREAVNADYDAALEAGAGGTPTFYLNGQQINFTSDVEIRSILEQTINNAS